MARNVKQLRRLIAPIFLFGLALWFVLNITVGDAFWWLTILNHAVPIQFIPLPLVLISALINKRWWLIGASIVLLLCFVWQQFVYLMPIFPTEPIEYDLRVMTYNVLKSNEDYTAVAKVIRSVEPDLVALQEVEETMFTELKVSLSDLYPYSTVAQLPDWQWNTPVILSRFPILTSETLDLEEIRPATLVRVEVKGRTLIFLSAHLYYYNWWLYPLPTVPTLMWERTVRQNRQVDILLDRIGRESGDVILACDCNSKVTQSSYRLLRKALHSAQATIAVQMRQPSVPATHFDRDMFNVDYIMYLGKLEVVSAYSVDDQGGSDHKAMISDFRFTHID